MEQRRAEAQQPALVELARPGRPAELVVPVAPDVSADEYRDRQIGDDPIARVDQRETLSTTLIDAEPDIREASAEPSIWPLLAAIATSVLFVGSVFTPWAVVWGSIPVIIALVAWFWPKRSLEPGEEPVIA